jgi:peptidyl-prolyl cis-trans isomerase B (cyclophilin B)
MSDIEAEIDSLSVSDFEETDQVTEYVKITVKDHGDIILRLRSDIAPITVANFQSLVSKGFYDGLTFHRVYKGFMIQGGDPNGDGTGGSDQTIKGEFSSNGVTNDLSHVRGVISMARSSAMDSASSQFFICHADSTFLDGNYASFGYVVAGLDTVDSVTNVAVQENSSGEISSPLSAVVIEKICFVTEKAS